MSSDATSRGIFGTGSFLHGGDYNPDQWVSYPGVVDEDIRLMKLAGCNTFSVGIFAWTSYEPEEGKFQFGWLDEVLDRFDKAGIRAILATPSGSKPNWMAIKYPEIRRVNEQGLREFQGERHNHCWTSPVYREKVRTINTKLAERYAGHPALSIWHISNEFNGHCYCDLCLASFHRWLEDRYTTLDALNHAWWTGFWSHTYTDWSQVDPRDRSVDGLRLDWMRFLTWQVADFYGAEIEPLKAANPEIPCTTNFMGLYDGLNYAELAKSMDIIADDQYPNYDTSDPELARSAAAMSFKQDLYRCFKPDRPFMLMESCPDATNWRYPRRLKRPGLHEAEMLQAIGHGAEGTLYFQWRKGRGGCEKYHGAVVDHDGREDNPIFQRVASYGKMLESLTPALGSTVIAECAVIFDWENRWAYEASVGVAKSQGEYVHAVQDHYIPLWEAGIPVDVFESDRDISGYKMVIAPMLYMLKPRVAERMRKFVEDGGTLVATYFTGMVNETNLCHLGGWPGEGLAEVFGVRNIDMDVQNVGTVRPVQASPDNALGLADDLTAREIGSILVPKGASVVATYTDDFYAGSPAVTVNSFGKGTAIYIGAKFDQASLRRIYGAVLGRLDLQPALDADIPAGVAVQRRSKDGQAFVFLQNFSVEPATLEIRSGEYKSLLTGITVDGSVQLPAGGSEVLTDTES
jgi:beta-galactosidase